MRVSLLTNFKIIFSVKAHFGERAFEKKMAKKTSNIAEITTVITIFCPLGLVSEYFACVYSYVF